MGVSLCRDNNWQINSKLCKKTKTKKLLQTYKHFKHIISFVPSKCRSLVMFGTGFLCSEHDRVCPASVYP